ncbi:hypothetical protein FDP41_011517 [Naegleria fowleri]|uniref:glutathione transferase n=1 Tax=Naegleria fowleri TaxID=5763 RepID=Q25556_NAEFO|nr:uncharacterized protein FDP41_011517 [Naegleria fowleri]AAB01781.1 glutathione S-transferase III homolog [Naegleria fowleri]KAF0982587.1 hypothetical protein FDP41_011517 [Naegleria fowleri]
MVLKLYGIYLSTCVQRVVTTLKEKNLDFELVPVDLSKGEHKQAAFLEKQPFGVIPVLEDDGFLIYESRAICRYLEAKFKSQGTQLIPTDLKALGLFEQGASIETSYFDPNVSGLAFELVFKGMFGGGAPDEARVKLLTQKLTQALDVYEKILAKQEYIGGNQFTLADLYHLPYGNYLFHEKVNLGHLINERPHVKAWWEKITKRDSWIQALKLASH